MGWLAQTARSWPKVTYREGGEGPRRKSKERPEGDTGPRTQDPTLLALESLVEAAQQVTRMTEHVTARAAHIRAWRMQGRPYREIVSSEDGPLIAGMLTEHIARLEAASTRFRRAEAGALHGEGMTMEEIGRLFGLTRQRISALIGGAAAASPSQTGDHDTSPPPTTGVRDHPGDHSPSP
jgi:hypothetical protein